MLSSVHPFSLGIAVGLCLAGISGCTDANLDDPRSGVPCLSNAQCGGYLCSESDSVCRDECDSSADCATGYACDTFGACIEAMVAECDSNRPCATGYTCDSNGDCVEAAPPCDTDADCDGFVCRNGEGCLDSCVDNDACSAGYACDRNGDCVRAEATVCSTDDDCEGAYACDEGSCFTSCTDGSECKGDAICVDSACETFDDSVFQYAAVVSTCANPEDLDTGTPGPDIDAIELSVGGSSVYAVVEYFNLGAGGDDQGDNARSNAAEAGGAPDTDCDASTDRYLSLGDTTGYLVVSFGESRQEIVDGAVLTVYELSNECNDTIPEREDSYAVLITNDEEEALNPISASSISSTWCLVGDSARTGGYTSFVIDHSYCEL